MDDAAWEKGQCGDTLPNQDFRVYVDDILVLGPFKVVNKGDILSVNISVIGKSVVKITVDEAL